jgi:hypothetical protein
MGSEIQPGAVARLGSQVCTARPFCAVATAGAFCPGAWARKPGISVNWVLAVSPPSLSAGTECGNAGQKHGHHGLSPGLPASGAEHLTVCYQLAAGEAR